MSAPLWAPEEPPAIVPSQPGAYQWWYFDAVSDDGATSLVAIFFVGSVFSPYYARRLARGEAPSPVEHVAVNLAIYRRGKRPFWVFSEYDDRRFELGERGIAVGRSSFRRNADGAYVVRIDDARVALGKRVLGEIRMTPRPRAVALTPTEVALAGPAHRWRCVVPQGRVQATFESPAIAFEGNGYHDVNAGDEPPARALAWWSWGRVHEGDRTRVFFDLARAHDAERTHLTFDSRTGRTVTTLAPRLHRPSFRSWLLPLPEAFDGGLEVDGARARSVVARTESLERAPFYERFLARFGGPAGAIGMAEHIDFTRFENPVVQRMIALRVARPDRGDRGWLP